MTDEQIIKALKCCKIGECDDCPFHGVKEDCEVELPEEVLDLINRQKAEIGELRSDKIIAESHEKAAKDLFVDCTRQLEEAKSELKQLQITLDEYPVKTLFGKNNMMCSKTSEDYEELIADISNNAINEFSQRLKNDTFLGKEKNSVEHTIWNHEIDKIAKDLTEVQK